MDEVLKYRSQIYGFCALWIVLHHLLSFFSIPGFSHIPLVYPFISMGSAGVDVFMFLSGYCLCLSFVRDSSISHFYEKRVLRLLVPYLIVAVPYFLWRNSTISAQDNGTINLVGFFCDITGISFWSRGMKNAWFVDAIFLFYLVFPFLFRVVSKSKVHALLAVVLSYIFIFLAYFVHFPGFDNYAIAISRFPAYLIGIILAYYHCAPHYSRNTLIVSALLLVLLVGLFPIKTIQEHYGLHGIFLWVPYILLVLPIIYLGRLFLAKWGSAFFGFLGSISLELYMVHVFLINILKWYGLNNVFGIWVWVLLPLISIPVAYIISLLSKRLSSGHLNRRSYNA